jgi:hypothetical protein
VQEVRRGGDRVGRVVSVLDAIAVTVDAIPRPGRFKELTRTPGAREILAVVDRVRDDSEAAAAAFACQLAYQGLTESWPNLGVGLNRRLCAARDPAPAVSIPPTARRTRMRFVMVKPALQARSAGTGTGTGRGGRRRGRRRRVRRRRRVNTD